MVKSVKKVVYSLIVLLIAAACVFAGGGAYYQSKAETAPEKPFIDMTKASYVDAMELGSDAMWEDTSAVYSEFKRLCDATGYFVYKVVLPADTTYFNMQTMTDTTTFVFISNDGTFPAHTAENPSTEASFEFGAAWSFETDLSEYIKTSKTVYIKFADPTPEDGNGAIIRYVRFNHNGTVTMPTYDDSQVSAVTQEKKTQSFKVNDADLTNYKVFDDGSSTGDSQEIRYYDGKNNSLFDDASKNNGRKILNAPCGVYKFTYSDAAQKVRINANLGQGYVFSVSNTIDPAKEADYTDQTKWTHLGGGKLKSGIISWYSYDVTSFMNANKTIYFRISDIIDLGGNGGYFLGAELYETQKAAAPTIAKPQNMTVSVRTLGEVTLPDVMVTSEDKSCVVTYAVKDASDAAVTVTGKKFTPTAFGVYTVTVQATDANSSVGETTFTVTVAKKTYAAPTITKPNDMTLTQSALADVTLPTVAFTSEDTNAKVTFTVKDKDGKDVAVTSGKFTPSAYGEYTVTATVKDGDNQIASTTFKITVKAEDKKGCGAVKFDAGFLMGGGALLLLAAAFTALAKKKSLN